MEGSDSVLNEFRSHYQTRDPRWKPPEPEARPAGKMKILAPAPATGVSFGHPPGKDPDMKGVHTYIWVIDDRGIPYVLDSPLDELGGECPKHTNLTSGGRAYVGGEVWFGSTDSLWVSGGSGRYHPVSATQLGDSARVFESFGYSVCSLGWDTENDKAFRFLGES